MWAIRGLVGLGLLLLLSPPTRLEAEETVYPLERVSIETSDRLPASTWHLYFGGQMAPCSNAPRAEVKAYPKPHSRRPLYGSVKFNSNYLDASDAVEYHFMIDQSDSPAKPDELASLLQNMADAISGETEQTKLAGGYDLFYFDANHDFDLTNDSPGTVLKDPPEMLRSMRGRQTFQPVRLTLARGLPAPSQPMELIPTLYVQRSSLGMVSFAPTVAYRGPVRLGSRAYNAILSQTGAIAGRFDQRFTALYLLGEQNPVRAPLSWSNWLCSVRQVDGRLYDISATPTGEKLIVRTYDGPFGSLQAGPVGRDLGKSALSGVIFSKQHILTLGEGNIGSQGSKPTQYRVPVGDYAVVQLKFECGQREFSLSTNPYLPGSMQRRTEPCPVYAMKIRENQPYVFNFSEKPVVQFLKSDNEQIVRPGGNARIQAVLILPSLNLMVSGLADKTQQIGQFNSISEAGEAILVPQYRRLQPMVTIQDSLGKTVAQGPMPFG